MVKNRQLVYMVKNRQLVYMVKIDNLFIW